MINRMTNLIKSVYVFELMRPKIGGTTFGPFNDNTFLFIVMYKK